MMKDEVTIESHLVTKESPESAQRAKADLEKEDPAPQRILGVLSREDQDDESRTS